MELRQLRHFVTVVEKGNLSDAATAELITQPAMSRSIKTLEDLLQVRLLDRLPRGIAVTEAGQKLFVEAQFILNECGRVHDEIIAYDSGQKGAVTLGVAPIFSATVIRSVVTDLTQHHPGIKLEIKEAMYPDLIAELRTGDIDLVVSIYPADDDLADLAIEDLYRVSASIIVGKSHPLANKKPFCADDFVDHKWVTTHERQSQNEVASLLSANQLLSPKDVVVTNSILLLRSLVIDEGFVCFAATDIFRHELSTGTVKMIALPSGIQRSSAGILSRVNRTERNAVNIVMQAIRKTVSLLDDEPKP